MPVHPEPVPRGVDALGRPVVAPPPSPALQDGGPAEMPAGFWRRAAAWLVDMALLTPVLVPLLLGPLRAGTDAAMALLAGVQDWTLEHVLAGTSLLGEAVPLPELARRLLADPAMHALVQDASTRLGAASLQGSLRVAAVAALYFAGFEASRWCATPGKRLLGLRVADLAFRRIGIGRALARFLAGGLSWATLNLGHALAGFRRDHRALHDLVAGTQVLARGPTPRSARWILSVAALVAVLLPVALAARVLASFSAGL